MTKRSTKNALLSSAVALLLCCSMLVGTTFAWFTDSVTSANNVIVAGNLDITLEYWDGDSWETVDGADKILDPDALWEPGYTEVVYLKLENKGSLALKYQIGANIVSETQGVNQAGEELKLSDYIYFDVVEGVNGETNAFDRAGAEAKKTEETLISEPYAKPGKLKAGDAPVYLAMIVYMPETVGNDANHNGTEIPKILLGINAFATQDTVESDSFNNQYDADTAVFTVADANAMLAENKDVTLVNCIEPNGILYVPKGYTGTLTLNSVSIASIQEGDAPATAALSEDAAEEIEATDIVILGNVVVRATEDGMSAITGTALNISGNGNLVAVANGKHAFGIGGAKTEYINIENVHIVDVKGGFVQPLFVNDAKYGKNEPEGGAAIGSGFKGAEINLTNVTIDNAQGGSKAAGIGAMFHTGVTINITNSTIKNVEGGNASAGIGGSRVSDDVAPAEQHVIINIKNSTVNATGGQFGAGIGSGYDTHCGEKNGAAFITETICTINIDATSDITAQGGKYAAGIGTGYHVAGLAGNIECEVNATAGESREKYTVAQNVGFGVVDHDREVKYLTTAPSLTYMGKVITVPAEIVRVAVTPDTLNGTDFTQENAIFSFTGDFGGNNVALTMPAGVENVIFDGSNATNINELIVIQNGTIIDNANDVVGERSGNVTVQNFNVLSQINVFACKTEVVVQNNTAEALMIHAGNCDVKVLNNTIDANFESHPTYRNETTTWNNNDYGIALNIFEYNLWLDGNTVTNSKSHAIGINGWEGTFDTGVDNKIESFKGNTITVNSTVKTDRAAFKVWDDETYASNDDDTNAVNATAQAFVDAVLADGSNTFNIVDGYKHTIFCFYNVNTNN